MNLEKQTIFRKLISWVLFTALSFFSAIFIIKNYNNTLCFLNFKIANQTYIKEQSKIISGKFKIGPKQYNQIAYFKNEPEVQNYIESEFGKNFLQNIISENIYYPQTWHARHYQDKNLNECIIKFDPTGNFYGFIENITEDTQGAALDKNQAKTIIESALTENFNLNLNNYLLLSQSQKKHYNKRIDHLLIYQRIDKTLGKTNFYKLRVILSGDKLTCLDHFIDIPESFMHKIKQEKNTCQAISYVANGLVYLLYLFLGCFIGLIYLIRKNLVLWKPAIFIGVLLSSLRTLTQLNELPSIEVNYATHYSDNNFLTYFILSQFILFIIHIFIYTLILAAAESLSRIAFQNHLQFFKSLKKDVIFSWSVFGKVIGSYLFIPLDFAFVIIFYLFSSNFGWFLPSNSLLNPNALISYFPAFNAVALPFYSAFWEECLYRVIPLSLGALIGQKFNLRKTGITVAFIFQALIFGAAHVNYQAVPGYARAFELILPSFAYAGIFLRFGLLPVLIIHFVYDAIINSITLFISSSGLFFQKFLVVSIIFLPLMIVILGKLFIRNLNNNLSNFRNFSLTQSLEIVSGKINNLAPTFILTKSKKVFFALSFLLGLMLLTKYTNLEPYKQKINDKTQDISVPEDSLKQQNREVDNKNKAYRNKIIEIIDLINLIALIIIIFIGLIKSIEAIKTKQFKFKNGILVAILFCFFSMIFEYANIANTLTSFDPSQSLNFQLILYFIKTVVIIVIESAVLGLLTGNIINIENQIFNDYKNFWLSTSITLFSLGIISLAYYFIYPAKFTNLDASIINHANPTLYYISFYALQNLRKIIYLMFLSKIINNKLNFKSIFLFIMASILVTIYEPSVTFSEWLLMVSINFALLYFIYLILVRYDIFSIPLIVIQTSIINLVGQVINKPYNMLWPLIITILFMLGYLLTFILGNKIFDIRKLKSENLQKNN